jgi:hypothetical protein
MSCTFDKEKLTGYFDGELQNGEKGEVEKHISACSECLRELGEIKSAALLVKTLPRLRAPRAIAEGVRREVGSTGRVHSLEKYRKSIFWTFSAAAAALLIGTVAYFAGREEAPVNDVARAPSTPAVGSIPSKADWHEAGEARKNVQEEGRDRKVDQLERRREVEKRDEPLADSAKKEEKKEEKVALAKGAPPAPKAGFGATSDEMEKFKDGNRGAGQRALAPEPPAAAKPAAPPGEALAKKLEEKAASPAPLPAPTKADPKPQAEGLRESALALKEMDKAAGEKAELQQNKQNANGTSKFTVTTPQVAVARAKAREVLAKWGADDTNAAPARAKTAGPDPGFIAVDLTPSQFAELKKQLETQSGARLVAGGPEDASQAQVFRADRGPAGGVGGGAGKPAEDAKRSAAPVATEAESKQPTQGRAGAEQKDRQAGDKAKDEKPANTLGAAVQAQSQPETRQKFILYFVEVAAGTPK